MRTTRGSEDDAQERRGQHVVRDEVEGAEEHPGEQHPRDRAAAFEDALQAPAEQRLLAERGQGGGHRDHDQPVGGRRRLQPLGRQGGAQRERDQLEQQDRHAPPGQADAEGERAVDDGNRPPTQGVPQVRMLPPEEEESREQDRPELGQRETRSGEGELEWADGDHQEEAGREQHERLANSVSFGVDRHAMIFLPSVPQALGCAPEPASAGHGRPGDGRHRLDRRRCPRAYRERQAAGVGPMPPHGERAQTQVLADALLMLRDRLPPAGVGVDRLGVGAQLQGREPQDLPVDLQGRLLGESAEHTHEGDLVRETQPVVGIPPQGDLAARGHSRRCFTGRLSPDAAGRLRSLWAGMGPAGEPWPAYGP